MKKILLALSLLTSSSIFGNEIENVIIFADYNKIFKTAFRLLHTVDEVEQKTLSYYHAVFETDKAIKTVRDKHNASRVVNINEYTAMSKVNPSLDVTDEIIKLLEGNL